MDPELASDVRGLLERAREAGVAAVVCVGYDLASSQAAVELARREAMCFAAVGIHPNYVSAARDTDLNAVEQLAAEPKVVAIGETGLDFFREFSDADDQRDCFRAHLALATRLSLPVIVHNRDASADTVAILNEWHGALPGDQPAGVLHCFSGDLDLMQSAAAARMLVSFAGPVTFKNARALPDVARAVSADGYVVETDSPYLSPHPYRGAKNEPSRVRVVAERLAELRACSLEQVALETSRNALRLFPALREQVQIPDVSA
jgi:TatD DNase family protein